MFTRNNPLIGIDLLGLADKAIVSEALKEAVDTFARSTAAQTSRLNVAIGRLGPVLSKITVDIDPGSVPDDAEAAYMVWWNEMNVRNSKPDKYDVLHEMVHAYNDITKNGLTDRDIADEGMAYALEQAVAVGLWRVLLLEQSMRGSDDLCYRQGALARFWNSLWAGDSTGKGIAKPEFYPGGVATFPGGRRTFALSRYDFINVKRYLDFRISCRGIAEALNTILEEKECCFRFSCEHSGDLLIGPGIEIDDIFR